MGRRRRNQGPGREHCRFIGCPISGGFLRLERSGGIALWPISWRRWLLTNAGGMIRAGEAAVAGAPAALSGSDAQSAYVCRRGFFHIRPGKLWSHDSGGAIQDRPAPRRAAPSGEPE